MAGGQGCIVIREDGNTIIYRKKCDRCGFVDGNQVHGSKPSPGSHLSASFFCPSCKNLQDVRLYG